jgi:predicted lipid-binding transport protein (Tim44 family)
VRRIVLSLFIGLMAVSFAAPEVEARRLGGGMSQGMKRQAPPQRTPDNPPAQQQNAAPAAAGTAAAPAAAGRRSWMGPIAGLAAGLGIAALMSHLGFGAGLANFLTMILLALAVFFVVRWALRRFAPASARPSGLGYASAGAGAGAHGMTRSGLDVAPATPAGAAPPLAAGAPLAASPVAGHTPELPPGFDRKEFERAAKMIFVRMQAANDASDLEDLRQFSTPEMFAAFRLDLQDRQGVQQRTDVVQLEAELLDIGNEGDRQIVSVRFHGVIREEADAAAAPFDEVWHLVRPADGSRPWAIAGIQQSSTTH